MFRIIHKLSLEFVYQLLKMTAIQVGSLNLLPDRPVRGCPTWKWDTTRDGPKSGLSSSSRAQSGNGWPRPPSNQVETLRLSSALNSCQPRHCDGRETGRVGGCWSKTLNCRRSRVCTNIKSTVKHFHLLPTTIQCYIKDG